MLSKLNIVVWATVAVLGFIPSAADAQQPTYKELGLKTVVIDPGHGGKDPGALGQSSSSHEKHIVLAVSKLLGEKIKEKYKSEFEHIKAPYVEAVLHSVPTHLSKVKAYELQFVFHSDGWFLLHCIVTLLNNGKLIPPTEEQKRALTTIIYPN